MRRRRRRRKARGSVVNRVPAGTMVRRRRRGRSRKRSIDMLWMSGSIEYRVTVTLVRGQRPRGRSRTIAMRLSVINRVVIRTMVKRMIGRKGRRMAKV